VAAGHPAPDLRQPVKTRRAIITFGRKNGKTALAAMLLLLHLCGPEARPNSQLYSAAQSRDQAALLFNLAAKMVRLSPTISAFVTPRDAVKELACPQLGTLYRALSAEATTAWGLSPVFVVHDELGQVKGPTSALYEATETATGGAPTSASLNSSPLTAQRPSQRSKTVLMSSSVNPGDDFKAVRVTHQYPRPTRHAAKDRRCNPGPRSAYVLIRHRRPHRSSEVEFTQINRAVGPYADPILDPEPGQLVAVDEDQALWNALAAGAKC
jgi:hypothetical protein